MTTRHYVWDLPLRIFHWALLVSVVGCFTTGSLGGNAFEWHFRFGYALIGLLAFRLIWGFAGSKYARFSSFPPSPLRALNYVQGKAISPAEQTLGHNPLGAFSVYAMLAALLFQMGTGLFANDAIMWDGPLRHLVTGATSDMLTGWHKINRWVIVGLVAMHLCAIAYYSFVKKEKLVQAMLTGYKDKA